MATEKYEVIAHGALIVNGEVKAKGETVEIEAHEAAPLVAAHQLKRFAEKVVEKIEEVAKAAGEDLGSAIGEAKFGE